MLDLYALLFLALGPLCLFGRILLSGQTLYYRDITLDFEPQTSFMMRSLHAGQLPIWNPLSAAGYPQMAGMQPPYFYPPSILFYYLDYPRALTLYLLFHFLLAGWGMYALARWWSWSRPSAALTGVLYMLSGAFVSLVEFYPSLPPAALLPLVVLAFDKSLQREARGPLLAATVLFALQISNGRPDISLMTTVFLLAYAGLRWLQPIFPGSGPGTIFRSLAIMMGGGILLNSTMLVPTIELLRHSTRLEGIPLVESGAHALSPFHLITWFIPGFFGDPEWGNDWGRLLLGEPYQHYSQLYLTLYPGLAAWLLAAAAWRSRGPLLRMLALVGVVALLLSFGNRLPIYGFVQMLPLFKWLRHAVKYYFLVNWCLILTAGLGCEVLLYRPRQCQEMVRSLLVLVVLSGVLVGLMAWQAAPIAAWVAGIDFARWVQPDPSGQIGPAAINAFLGQAVQGYYWIIWRHCLQAWLMLAGMGFLISLWTAQVMRREMFISLFLLLALADVGAANGRLLFTTEADMFDQKPPVADFLESAAGSRQWAVGAPLAAPDPLSPQSSVLSPANDFRILTTPASPALAEANLAYLTEHDLSRSLQDKLHRQSRAILDNNIGLDFGLATGSIYASMVPFQGPNYLWHSLQFVKNRGRRSLPPERRAVLEGLMSVRDLITERAVGTPPVPPPGYKFAWEAPLAGNPNILVTVFRNRYFIPRAHFVTSARLVASLGTASYLIVRQEWDHRRWVMLVRDAALEETLQIREQAPHTDPGRARVCRIVASEDNRVTILNESPESGFLVLADIYYPGWKVTVDGEDRPLLNADAIFRAVYVEAGTHTVTFSYDPVSGKQGLGLSLLVVLQLLLWVSGGRRRRTWFTGFQGQDIAIKL